MASPQPSTHSPITPDNHAPLIEIALYFLMVTFILAVIIRFAIRLAIARSISTDDWVSFASMIAGIGQCIAVATGVRNGMGKQEHLLTKQQTVSVTKTQYASGWFYMAALCLAKVSVLLLLQRLAVNKRHKRIALYTVGVVLLWALAGIVALAARCGSKLPWNVSSSDQCINPFWFWVGMAPVDICTELVILILPVLMMVPVQVAMSKKAVIVVAFSFRALVVAATIVRLFYISASYPAPNFTFDMVDTEIVNQIVLSFSITTACIPCLKPFLDAFDSGQMAVVIEKGRATGSHSGSRSYPLQDLSYGRGLGYGTNKSTVTSAIDAAGDERDLRNNRRQHQSTNNNTLPNEGTAYPIGEKEENSANDGHSVASSTKSDQMIIKKNVSYTVQYEDASHEDLER